MVKVIRLTSDWPLLAKVACAVTVVIGVFLFQFPLEERGSAYRLRCFWPVLSRSL